MATKTVYAVSSNADEFMSMVDGGEWSSALSLGSDIQKDFRLYMGTYSMFKGRTGKINSVKIRLYPKQDRSNTTLYKYTLRYRTKVDGAEYVNGSENQYLAWGGAFPSSYPSAPWEVTLDGWTMDRLNRGMVLWFQLNYTGYLKTTAFIKGVHVIIDYTLNTYTLTVNAEVGGTVSGGGTYESGSTATIKATPNSGYRFVRWSDGSTDTTRTVTVTANATYSAIFEEIEKPPKFTSVKITPNPVIAGEAFILTVGVE